MKTLNMNMMVMVKKDDDNDDDEEHGLEDLALDGTSNPSQSKQSSALATSIIQ